MKNVKEHAIVLILLLAGALSFAQSQPSSSGAPSAKPSTLTGVISDSMCGATHMTKDKSAAECTRTCVKEGSDYALVVGSKVYALKGNATDLDKYAGERVMVKGTISGDTITAESIRSAKRSKKS